MNILHNHVILADGRWQGPHGIGRFSVEVLSRLKHADILTAGPSPLSLKNLFWQSYFLSKKQKYKLFFTPGFNPILFSSIPFVLTIHDLIHLHFPGKAARLKKIFYETLIRSSAKKAYKIITVSEYSKRDILEWLKLPEEKVVVVNNGISAEFTAEGTHHEPGFPYLLHVGNTKAHKNVNQLLQAFARAKIDSQIKLIMTAKITDPLTETIRKNKLENRIIVSPTLSEKELAEYYRGSLGLAFPSLYEGFGLPVVEAMACGVPVLTSNITSLPEVAGDAALLVDPYAIDSIAYGIEQLVSDMTLRRNLVDKGLKRATMFSWEQTASKIQAVLDGVLTYD